MNEFPKVSLGIFPTPVQRLENISSILGADIYVKRDDMTGLGLGGNKVRKLEYLLADAKDQGAQVVFTTGGAQSNHAMLTAAAARRNLVALLRFGLHREGERPATAESRGLRRAFAHRLCSQPQG